MLSDTGLTMAFFYIIERLANRIATERTVVPFQQTAQTEQNIFPWRKFIINLPLGPY